MKPHQAATIPSSFVPFGYLPAPDHDPAKLMEQRRSQIRVGRGKHSDLYQTVTDTVIAQLEAGAVPWVQPWGRPNCKTPAGLPTNGDTGRTYSGINILLLWGAAIETSRTTQTWLTYKRGGHYSASAHMEADNGARPGFIEAHIRRLEAMRRAGHAERHKDGTWSVPPDYLKRAARFEKSKAFSNPVDVQIVSNQPLKKLAKTMGRTWLDEQLSMPGIGDNPEGFGEDVETAKTLRRKYLLDEAIIGKLSERISSEHLHALEARDLAEAAEGLSENIGKPYSVMPEHGKVSGKYVEAIDRPSGRYGVIERSKDFTLVPWRETLERSRGRSVTGDISGRKISWTLNKGRDIS